MNVLVLGGDLRYLEVINHLSINNSVDVIGFKNYFINDKVNNVSLDCIDISKYNVIIFPVGGVSNDNTIKCFNNSFRIPDDFLVNCRPDVLIFSGISTPCLNNILGKANRSCCYIMKDKDVISKNVIPTVEGIIADIILNTDITIRDSSITVFGYGNIGSVLVDYLRLLGANVSVAVVENFDKLKLDSLGIDCFYSYDMNALLNNISSTDVIVNTAPTTVIDDSLIKFINRDSYVLDIASHPHGISREVLDTLFIKNKLYLGIPGKVAPITSGKILTKKIDDVMGGK